jgi:hypothetical protein
MLRFPDFEDGDLNFDFFNRDKRYENKNTPNVPLDVLKGTIYLLFPARYRDPTDNKAITDGRDNLVDRARELYPDKAISNIEHRTFKLRESDPYRKAFSYQYKINISLKVWKY